MTGRWLLALVLAAGCIASGVMVQPAPTPATQVDPQAEIAAALYAASATQAAAERVADAKLRAQRKQIDALHAKVRAGARQHQAALIAAEEKYVAALAERDRAYAQEIAIFRKTVEDIAATPEGAAALARFNAGDELGALAVLDQLRAARDAARKTRADIESAVEGRLIATLALETRNKGKLTTAQVITRYEEVTRLDPAVHSDWIELGNLYEDPGNLPAALASYRTSQAIADRLVQVDPGNTTWQRDLAASHSRIGDVQVAQGNLAGALTSHRAVQAIADRLVQADPGNTARQRDVAASSGKIGEIQEAQGDLLAAFTSYRAAQVIFDRLVQADPGNTAWQHALWKPKEIYITENGCGGDDVVAADGKVYDSDRLMYLRNGMMWQRRATSEGIPLKGSFYWSTMDNFEWTAGYGNRFGLVYVDFKTQQRIPKLSAEWFREAARRNAVV